VFGKRDTGRENSENGAGVNFAVGVIIVLRAPFQKRVSEIGALHSNHTEILFFGVNVFDDCIADFAVRNEIVPAQFFAVQFTKEVGTDERLVVFYAQNGASDSAGVTANADFLVSNVEYDGGVDVDHTPAFFLLQNRIQFDRVSADSDPRAVYKHFDFIV
jgi:hypothetical protein